MALSGLFRRLLRKLDISRSDVTVLVLSLFLASGIWMSHTIDKDYTVNLRVPVIAVSNIPGHAIESSNSVMLEATCKTSGRHAMSLRRKEARKPRKITFDKDVFSHREGDDFFVPSSALNSYVTSIFGPEVSLEAFVSGTGGFTFTFPSENYRKVAVIPDQQVTYRSQYMSRGGVRVEPDSVIVYGEPSRLEDVDFVRTSPVKITGLHSSRSGVASLVKPSGVRLSEDAVNYSIDVYRYVEVTRTVHVEVLGAPAGKSVSVYPATAQVAFRCVYPMLKDKSEDVTVYIDYQDFASSISGRCVARYTPLPKEILDCRVTPEIFDCFEEVR